MSPTGYQVTRPARAARPGLPNLNEAGLQMRQTHVSRNPATQTAELPSLGPHIEGVYRAVAENDSQQMYSRRGSAISSAPNLSSRGIILRRNNPRNYRRDSMSGDGTPNFPRPHSHGGSPQSWRGDFNNQSREQPQRIRRSKSRPSLKSLELIPVAPPRRDEISPEHRTGHLPAQPHIEDGHRARPVPRRKSSETQTGRDFNASSVYRKAMKRVVPLASPKQAEADPRKDVETARPNKFVPPKRPKFQQPEVDHSRELTTVEMALENAIINDAKFEQFFDEIIEKATNASLHDDTVELVFEQFKDWYAKQKALEMGASGCEDQWRLLAGTDEDVASLADTYCLLPYGLVPRIESRDQSCAAVANFDDIIETFWLRERFEDCGLIEIMTPYERSGNDPVKPSSQLIEGDWSPKFIEDIWAKLEPFTTEGHDPKQKQMRHEELSEKLAKSQNKGDVLSSLLKQKPERPPSEVEKQKGCRVAFALAKLSAHVGESLGMRSMCRIAEGDHSLKSSELMAFEEFFSTNFIATDAGLLRLEIALIKHLVLYGLVSNSGRVPLTKMTLDLKNRLVDDDFVNFTLGITNPLRETFTKYLVANNLELGLAEHMRSLDFDLAYYDDEYRAQTIRRDAPLKFLREGAPNQNIFDHTVARIDASFGGDILWEEAYMHTKATMDQEDHADTSAATRPAGSIMPEHARNKTLDGIVPGKRRRFVPEKYEKYPQPEKKKSKKRAESVSSAAAPKQRAESVSSAAAPKQRAASVSSAAAPKQRAASVSSAAAPKQRAASVSSAAAPKQRAASVSSAPFESTTSSESNGRRPSISQKRRSSRREQQQQGFRVVPRQSVARVSLPVPMYAQSNRFPQPISRKPFRRASETLV